MAGIFYWQVRPGKGKEIGHANADIIREAAKHHEVGLHAWDHHAWQAHSGNWDRQTLVDDIARGLRTWKRS